MRQTKWRFFRRERLRLTMCCDVLRLAHPPLLPPSATAGSFNTAIRSILVRLILLANLPGKCQNLITFIRRHLKSARPCRKSRVGQQEKRLLQEIADAEANRHKVVKEMTPCGPCYHYKGDDRQISGETPYLGW